MNSLRGNLNSLKGHLNSLRVMYNAHPKPVSYNPMLPRNCPKGGKSARRRAQCNTKGNASRVGARGDRRWVHGHDHLLVGSLWLWVMHVKVGDVTNAIYDHAHANTAWRGRRSRRALHEPPSALPDGEAPEVSRAPRLRGLTANSRGCVLRWLV